MVDRELQELIDKIWSDGFLTDAQLKQLEEAGYARDVSEYRMRERARTMSYFDVIREIGGEDGDGEYHDAE